MKRSIELNGVANIQLLMQLEVDRVNGGYYMNSETYQSILNELKHLQTYMIEYCKAVNAETDVPYWHDIKKEK